jgi:LacI family transcriptional regulator
MNIKDVAKIAGVSISTVSLVLNNKLGVSEGTRIRVLAVMEKLNYVPNNIARSLVTKRTASIGLIVPDISDVFYAQLGRAVQDAVAKKGYSMILCNSENSPEKEATYLNFLKEKKVDGIIMVPGGSINSTEIEQIDTPIVFVDRYTKGVDISYVGVDNEKGGYEATKHLIKLGHERVGCICGPNGASSSEERIAGYKKALAESGLRYDEVLLRGSNWTVGGGFYATKELLSLKASPTAIFTTSDICAIGVFDALGKEGLKVPEDIAVVGFDDIKFAPYMRVPLTTVRQPVKEMGEISAKLLLEELSSKKKSSSRKVILNTKLIVRESCGFKKQHLKY